MVSDLKLEKLVDFKKMRFFPGQFGGAPWTGWVPEMCRYFRATSARRRFTRSSCTYHDSNRMCEFI
jgi:hypothetical protein